MACNKCEEVSVGKVRLALADLAIGFLPVLRKGREQATQFGLAICELSDAISKSVLYGIGIVKVNGRLIPFHEAIPERVIVVPPSTKVRNGESLVRSAFTPAVVDLVCP